MDGVEEVFFLEDVQSPLLFGRRFASFWGLVVL